MSTTNLFFERPILNSPYKYPARHWELDASGQPTQRIIEKRRRAEFITPIPTPRKRKGAAEQRQFVFNEGKGLSTEKQQYDPTSIINQLRQHVDQWRSLPNSNQWQVTPETARLLQHWRHHQFSSIRPFFCQVEAAETAIWLIEVAPQAGKSGKAFIEHLANANHNANPELMRFALKLATGAGKTTVMAMLIAWQTINAVRRPQSKKFTRGFLVVTPGLTIKDRLRVLQPNDLWISGLEAVNRTLGVACVIDLSATPFFLRGSGEAEGTLFPWTLSDFSLMDAIECGIVKLPRVPVADNIPGEEMPMFRNLWEHIRSHMPKKGRGKSARLDPLSLPPQLQTAIEALYGHYEKTFDLWDKAGIRVPPCFIVVCQNTAISKLVYDFISGFLRENDDGSKTPIAGRLALFRNCDEHGNPFARPNTLLIDSEQLESHQIRMQADRLLAPEVTDADGNTEERGNTISVFNGPAPTIRVCDSLETEKATVSKWIQELQSEGVMPHEVGVFVRSAAELDRARAAVKEAGLAFKILDEKVETTSGHVSISTMHLAKGLEFRAVVVMACDDEVIPLQERIETVADDADLEDVYNTERHLLYVACTRARDHLLVTSVAPASEFLDDLQM